MGLGDVWLGSTIKVDKASAQRAARILKGTAMSMLRIAGIGVAAVGVVLLIMGLNATDTFGEGVVKTFTGHYSDQTVWYIAGGIAGIVIGGAMAAMGVTAKSA
jgi:hypothetical protein